jgi:hypothetical protein
MRNARSLALAAGVLLAAAPPAPAAAQDTPAAARPYRFTAGGYLANYWLDRGGNLDRASVGGYGLRLMFNRSDASRAARSFFDRASVGLYATFTSEQDEVATQNVGGEVDVSLFPAPIANGVLDPFVALAAGAIRSDTDVAGGASSTDFVLTPAAGTRIPFFSGMGFRGDLRLPVVFSDGDARLHFLVEGGLYISF